MTPFSIQQFSCVHVLIAACLLNVFRTRGLVFLCEVLGDIFAKPDGQLDQLLAETIDRLGVHVGLSDDLGQRD